MKSYFPDINVWLALTYRGHQHHPSAASWFESLKTGTLVFCRLTQLGFLRLLTYPAVMRDEVRSELGAWQAYDLLLSDARVGFREEPDSTEVESELRSLTGKGRLATQQWPDAYLAAFARVADLTLVTLDQALGRLAGQEVLLLE